MNARFILLIGIMFSCVGAASAADEPAKLRDELAVLEKGSWEMIQKKNVAGMRDYLADDVVLIFGDGTRYTKAEFLKLLPDFTLDAFAIEGKMEMVTLTPDAATLIYRITYTSAVKNEKPGKSTVLASSTYVRRGGKWLNAFYQETPAK